MTPATCGVIGSSAKGSENWSQLILSIGLGRYITTTMDAV